MSKVQIIPAILATTEEEYQQKIQQIESSGLFTDGWVQIDLMDGKFVQNVSISPEVVKKHSTSFKYEIHLMVEDPLFWASQFREFPRAQRFIVPIELPNKEIDEFIGQVRVLTDAEIGFSFEPATPLSKLKKYQNVAESILIMGVHSGFSGQDFIPGTLKKIQETAKLVKENELDCLVGVDGGVNHENARMVIDAGADYLVIGSHLLEGDIDENLGKIWEALNG